jgi:hypothetical protein
MEESKQKISWFLLGLEWKTVAKQPPWCSFSFEEWKRRSCVLHRCLAFSVVLLYTYVLIVFCRCCLLLATHSWSASSWGPTVARKTTSKNLFEPKLNEKRYDFPTFSLSHTYKKDGNGNRAESSPLRHCFSLRAPCILFIGSWLETKSSLTYLFLLRVHIPLTTWL